MCENLSISVLMCVYEKDDPSYFNVAYKTALNQTLLPTEFVLVVDGPINAALDVEIKSLQQACITKKIIFKKVNFKINKGHGEARRSGVQNCTSKYVAIFDADDIYDERRLELQASYLEEHSEITIVGSQIIEVDSNSLTPLGRRVLPFEHDDIMRIMKTKCPMNQMTVMFIRDNVLAVGNYQSLFHNEDYYLWIRLAENGYRFHNLNLDLVKARVNPLFYKRRGGLDYFISELKIQKLLLKKKFISQALFIFNVSIRFVIQVLLPERVRGLLFKLMFRKKAIHV